ncbi:RDD family protein [Lacibacter cauensis]|uniref:RDD family protein n=1 Tax=Lacibacter cauensis TaxID=510947 RepID=A0A562SK58_9BACT|nr:RDD family protein [Lacibacter cauensis]
MENNDTIFSDIQKSETEASYFKKFSASLIDWIFELALIFSSYIFLPRSIILEISDSDSILRFFIILIFIILYRLVCLLLFNKTIGMGLLRLKYLNSSLQPLSVKEKIIASFAPKVSDIKTYNNG